MANSMTGFGRANVLIDGREITVELKSVNHRFLDLGFRMPRHISFLEDEIRRQLTERLTRGHVDVFVSYRNTRTDARTAVVDGALLNAYITATMLNINCKIVEDLKITLPPLSLQQSFAAKIESIEKQKAAISKSIAETEKLFEYTMDKYFG